MADHEDVLTFYDAMAADYHLIFQDWVQHRVAIGVVGIVLVVLIALIIAGYSFDWAGFNGSTQVTTAHTISGPSAGTVVRTEVYQPGKTLWDWLGLLAALAIPVVVGFGVAWFTAQQGKVSAQENTDNQRERALQAYIDKISELLLKEHLGELTPEGKFKPEYEQVRQIARVRTLTLLSRLDANRKRSVLQFLFEAGLIYRYQPIIDLSEGDFSGANLSGVFLLTFERTEVEDVGEVFVPKGVYLPKANLRGANLKQATLWDAHLRDADLREANLSGANLKDADLFGAKLNGANLSGANLSGANLDFTDLSGATFTPFTQEQLEKARSLMGAIMPNGSRHR